MKRIILMVVTNLFFVIVCWPKLCRMAAHPERYTKEERWKHLQFWVEPVSYTHLTLPTT